MLRAGSEVWTGPKRLMSYSEASVALRPFYFAVHPDRFGTHPEIRKQNERSLQIFNGYINDLYPVTHTLRPVQLKFSIAVKKDSFRVIDVHLAGTDPIKIVRTALKSCDLKVDHLKKEQARQNVDKSAFESTTFNGKFGDENDLLKSYLRRKGHAAKDNLVESLTKCRDQANHKAKEATTFRVSMKDDIDDLKSRTGLKDVLWEIEWAESHMRRCISNMHRFIDNADQARKELTMQALCRNVLRFGRGSFTCCDGSIQLGADNVPEQWEKAISEHPVRKSQINELKSCVGQLQSTFGGAVVLTPYYKGMAQTLSQMQSLIVRIWNREALLPRLAKAGAHTMIEVVTTYDDLSVGIDGRIFVPCNVDVPSLVVFLEQNAEKSRQVNQKMQLTMEELEDLVLQCKRELHLPKLEWERALKLEDVLACVRRLVDAEGEARRLISGLAVLISQNPTIYILNDGTVSIPFNWK